MDLLYYILRKGRGQSASRVFFSSDTKTINLLSLPQVYIVHSGSWVLRAVPVGCPYKETATEGGLVFLPNEDSEKSDCRLNFSICLFIT